MKKIATYTLGLLALAFVFSCKKEEEQQNNFTVTTDFDKSTIESKMYSLGDTVKANITIKFVSPQDEIRTDYSVGGTLYTYEKIPVSSAGASYLYKLKLPLDSKIFKSVNSTMITITTNLLKPLQNGGGGGLVTSFKVNFK